MRLKFNCFIVHLPCVKCKIVGFALKISSIKWTVFALTNFLIHSGFLSLRNVSVVCDNNWVLWLVYYIMSIVIFF